MEDLICIYQISSKSIYKRRTDCFRFRHGFSGYDRVIDTHIKNLRKKIEDDPKNPIYLCTVHGIGYKFGGNIQ